jgi:hypothetical protein
MISAGLGDDGAAPPGSRRAAEVTEIGGTLTAARPARRPISEIRRRCRVAPARLPAARCGRPDAIVGGRFGARSAGVVRWPAGTAVGARVVWRGSDVGVAGSRSRRPSSSVYAGRSRGLDRGTRRIQVVGSSWWRPQRGEAWSVATGRWCWCRRAYPPPGGGSWWAVPLSGAAGVRQRAPARVGDRRWMRRCRGRARLLRRQGRSFRQGVGAAGVSAQRVCRGGGGGAGRLGFEPRVAAEAGS